MSWSFYCPCGFWAGGDGPYDITHEPPSGSCCNCGGRKCMDCVLRYVHDVCEHTCPDCEEDE